MKFTVAKKAIALTGAVAMLGSVAACGSDTASGKPAQDKDVTEITVWAWEPTLTQVAKDFTKKTGIKVDLKNVGAVRRQGLRPADGFRPNGLLLQQGGLRQGRC